MIREIVKDENFLSRKSSPASKKDSKVILDLIDTLNAWSDSCIGMAANMIGERKNIIIANIGVSNLVMVNPIIIDQKDPYETEEGCLCLIGTRKTVRYQTITVRYRDQYFEPQLQTFTGLSAQIIQHEIDHTRGIVI